MLPWLSTYFQFQTKTIKRLIPEVSRSSVRLAEKNSFIDYIYTLPEPEENGRWKDFAKGRGR